MAAKTRWKNVARHSALAVLFLSPLLVAAAAQDGLRWFAAGAIVWAFSVAGKIPLAGLLHWSLGQSAKPAMSGAAHGVLSAACELGGAAACFAWLLTHGNAWSAAAFGAGAGWIERASAVLGHIGSRGLVWLAMTRHPWLAIPAVMGFSIVDGLAVYGTILEWDWLERKTWLRFYGTVTAISAFELALFIALA